MNGRIDDIDFSLDARGVRGAACMNLPVNLCVVLLGSDRGPLMYLYGDIDRAGRVVVVKCYRATTAESALTGFRRQLGNFDTDRRSEQAQLEIAYCNANRHEIAAATGNS